MTRIPTCSPGSTRPVASGRELCKTSPVVAGREGESRTSLSSASPHLPVAPARAAAANQVGPRLLALVLGDTAQGLRHSAEWRRVVGAARDDHALPPARNVLGQLTIPVPHPGGGAPTLWGRTEFSTLDMASESQLVYKRLNFLIAETTAALSRSTGSGVLDDVGRTMSRLGARLRWDAALDLILADRLSAESKYESGLFGHARDGLRAAYLTNVRDLRDRVLCAIEALTVIHRAALFGDSMARLSADPVSLTQLDDALTWFRCYAEAYEELAATYDPPPSSNRSRRAKRRHLGS
jgi:hypothetical protein